MTNIIDKLKRLVSSRPPPAEEEPPMAAVKLRAVSNEHVRSVHGLAGEAVRILDRHRDSPLGSSYPFHFKGINYVGLLSLHPPNATHSSPYPGVSLFFAANQSPSMPPPSPGLHVGASGLVALTDAQAAAVPGLGAEAVKLLNAHRGEVLGSTYPFTFKGVNYVGLLSTHTPNATNPNPHPGISLFFADSIGAPAPPATPAVHLTLANPGPHLLPVPGLSKTTPEFQAELLAMSARLQTNPNFITSVMSIESAQTFSPKVKNPGPAGAVGLIQFIPSTAKRLGTTMAALAAMTAVEQLAYVEKYLKFATGRMTTVGRTYMAVFNPASFKDPERMLKPDFVLYSKGSKGYDQNLGLDRNKDGVITVSDVTSTVEAVLSRALGLPPIKPSPLAVAVAGGGAGTVILLGLGLGLLFYLRHG